MKTGNIFVSSSEHLRCSFAPGRLCSEGVPGTFGKEYLLECYFNGFHLFHFAISSLNKGYIHGNIPVKFSTVLENSCVCRKIFGYD